MELKRQAIHVSAGFLVLTLPLLPYWGILCLSLMGILFNLFFLPRLFPSIMRKTSGDRRGVVFYPVSVAALVLLFPNRLEIVAGAWAILSFGDGMATVVGRLGRPMPLRWNAKKTVQGSAACFAFGALACFWTLMWMAWMDSISTEDWTRWAIVSLVAAAAAAWIESMPLPVNDNVTVPAAAAGVLALSLLVEVDKLHALNGWSLWAAFLANAVFASILTSFRIIRGSATWAGVVIGSVLWACAGWQCYLLLILFFVLGTWATLHGYELKFRRGVAQENGGRRGARNVVANCGFPTLLAFLMAATRYEEWLVVGLVAGLATATFDTLASELGQVYGRSPVLPTTGESVAIGTEGAISMEGTFFGLAGALLVGGLAWALTAIPASTVPVVVVAAFAGSCAESVIAALLRFDFTWRNDLLNFTNTVIGSLVAIVVTVQITPLA